MVDCLEYGVRGFVVVMACLTLLVFAAPALAQQNLVRNPSFETDANGNGVPDNWIVQGDPKTVTQTLTIGKGRDGKHCGFLNCTNFGGVSPSVHAMIAQMGVPVTRGKLYRVTLWARAEDLLAGGVGIALSNTKPWANCGLRGSFVPLPDSRWGKFEFIFRATSTVGDTSRFQIWFMSTGKLWIDDVEFAEFEGDPYRPGQVHASAGRTNLIPNASFECGTTGWGSSETDRLGHWGGGLNRLFGVLDRKETFDGKQSLRIDMTPEKTPVSSWDYFGPFRALIRAPLAGNMGFFEVEQNQPYTFSVYLKAAEPDTPAMLSVKGFSRRTLASRNVRVSQDWQRYSLRFTPKEKWCFVLVGPDLRRAGPDASATLWVDALQLEKGETPTAFQPRQTIELGLETDKVGNVFDWTEPVKFRVAVANGSDRRRVKVELSLTDFQDETVWSRTLQPALRARDRFEQEVRIEPTDAMRGFLHLNARTTVNGRTVKQRMRLAVIPTYKEGDSRFGINHAYPWPHLLDLCRQAGLMWMRDWSLLWEKVEPQKGTFDFGKTDPQIDRILKHDLRVLGMFPFPSSPWSSTGPDNTARSPRERLAVLARAPRDVDEVENYIARTVKHYKGRIRWYQYLNEPLYTHYALPHAQGNDGATYARLTEAFARAARRSDPDCKLLAGIGGLNHGRLMNYFEDFFKAGGLKHIDAVDIHQYPGVRPPEYMEVLINQLNERMDKHGGRKPLWMTEFGYYADDDPTTVPIPHRGFDQPLADENLHCSYIVRWAAVLMASGVEKFFYHAGTCDRLNRDSFQGIFFEYGGTPHKVYAAQAVLSHLLTPERKFAGKMSLGADIKGYLFADKDSTVAVVWAPGRKVTRKVRLTGNKLVLWDIMGRPQKNRSFTPGEMPYYVVGKGMSPRQLRSAVK